MNPYEPPQTIENQRPRKVDYRGIFGNLFVAVIFIFGAAVTAVIAVEVVAMFFHILSGR